MYSGPTFWADIFERFAGNVLFHDQESGDWTYGDVLRLRSIMSMLIEERCLVICLIDNDASGLAGYLALLASGTVALLMSSKSEPSVVDRIVHDYKPAYQWMPRKSVERMGLASSDVLYESHSYCLVRLDNDNSPMHPELSLLVATSGSTGSPKYVRLSYSNIIANALSIAEYLGLTEDEVPVTSLPPQYSYGFSVIHSHLLVGAKIVVTKYGLMDREYWKVLDEYRVTSMACVPHQFEILDRLRFGKMDLPYMRYITQAGGRMAPESVRKFAEILSSKGKRLIPMYGQTEASPRMAFLSANDVLCKPDSIGKAIPGGQLRIESEDGVDITASGQTGELVYEGANVCWGYAIGWRDLDRENEMKGVLRTGDLARCDEDGDFFIVGRINRIVKLYGHRVNLDDIESRLAEEGYVAAASGVDDMLSVFVEGCIQTQALELKFTLADFLNLSAAAIRVFGLEALPRSESGKIMYSSLDQILSTEF